MEREFELHEKLDADTIALMDWPLCRVLLMNDSNFPWLVLVPRRPGLGDLDDVDLEDLPFLWDEVRHASKALKHLFEPEKMNVAALGNQVPQLHIHVIARFSDDPAWPKPVWGAVPPKLYSDEGLRELLGPLKHLLAGR